MIPKSRSPRPKPLGGGQCRTVIGASRFTSVAYSVNLTSIRCRRSRYKNPRLVDAIASRQSSSQFGIDPAVLKTIDWKLGTRRVVADIRSDFIYAPHFSAVFRHAANDLIAEVEDELKSGRFGPGIPITIDVPKSSRMHVVPRGSRGPTFSRAGSIFLPKDRLVYQILADQAAPLIKKNTNGRRSFSHRVLPKDPEMFEASRASWNRMQTQLK